MTSKHDPEVMGEPIRENEGTEVESDKVAILPEGFSASFTDKAIRAR